MLRVHSFETFGTLDGPGIRLVIFLQGCNMRCLYCHNPDTWSMQGGEIIKIPELVKLALKNKEYYQPYGGVTVSGGEPLLQRFALFKLFRELKQLGFHTALDTNGSILDQATKDLLEVTDLVLLDIKQIDNNKHIRLTGLSNAVPLKFAKYLQEINKPFWLCYVLVPGYTDARDDLLVLKKHFASFNNLKEIKVIPYHRLGVYKYRELGLDYGLEHVQPPSSVEVKLVREILHS